MKKISLKKDDIKNNLNKFKNSIIFYIKHNRLFLSFIILSLISTTLLRGFTLNNWFNINAMLFDL